MLLRFIITIAFGETFLPELPQPGDLFVRRNDVSKMEAARLIRIDDMLYDNLTCRYTVLEDDLYPEEIFCIQFKETEYILKYFIKHPYTMYSKIWRQANGEI